MRSKQLLLHIFLALVAASAISFLKLEYIESYLYDLRVSLRASLGFAPANSSPIILVKINKQTVESLKGLPNYQAHSQFINKIFAAQAKALAYDFRTKEGEIRDIAGTEEDKRQFSESIAKFKNVYLPSEEIELVGESGKLKLSPPLENIQVEPSGITEDTLLLAKDGVTRRIILRYQNQNFLQLNLAKQYNPELNDFEKIRGVFELLGSDQVYINYYNKNSFPTYAFEDILNEKVSLESFKDHLVIIGTDTGLTAKEYILTPYSREINAMTTLEMNAHMIQTLIDNAAPVKWPKWASLFLTFIISALTIHVVLTIKPSRGILILLAGVSGLTLIGIILFLSFNIWLEVAHPLLALFLCYYFFIPYRLIIENRKSWEYFQKNKLLQQVEELKTNFISMMSHDLKTPIARIQGMTEVISKDQNLLSSIQREAVDTIKQSSDDLLRFISSILQYGRIESEGLILHKQSKDINQLLEDVIKKHEFLAKLKKIKIKTELEPLFPISIDPQLIYQVFSNLIENAIKYSPEDSQISVHSKEESNQVVIHIIDRGIGIPDTDLPNIFMKFFRTHNVKTSSIKGSGLGLYLAKYFIELHKGQIEVSSQSGQGSKFTVILPI